MELPKHHYWTRWWLRRYCHNKRALVMGIPDRVVLYDRCLRSDVGASLRYPQELEDAAQQVRSLRQRDVEPIDMYLFCDEFGDAQ